MDYRSQQMLSHAERLRARADALELALEESSLVEALNSFQEEIVIFFKKRFHDGITYTYAAVRYGVGGSYMYWATTGPRSGVTATIPSAAAAGCRGTSSSWRNFRRLSSGTRLAR